MSRVLVLGGAGYIGSAVADAFLQQGFVVFGTTRSAARVKQLKQRCIAPVVVSSAQDVSSWLPVAERCSLVVECLGDKEDKKTAAVVSEALIAMLQRRKATDFNVIFTTGVFSYGSDPLDRFRVFSEDDSYEHSCRAALWRHPIEAAYRAAGAVCISPGMTYGEGGGPIITMLAKRIVDAHKQGAEEAKMLSCFGDGSQYLSCVHRRDLGALYALVGSRAHELRGHLINCVSSMERYDTICDAVARHIGFKGKLLYLVPPETDPKLEAFGSNIRISSQKARNLLGWKPMQQQFSAIVSTEMEAYASKE